jgi:ferredoxin
VIVKETTMDVRTVWFEGSCVRCAMCAEEAWEVFSFHPSAGVQLKINAGFGPHSEKIKSAVLVCPTERIKYR